MAILACLASRPSIGVASVGISHPASFKRNGLTLSRDTREAEKGHPEYAEPCGKAIDPRRVTALGGLASIAQAPKSKGQTGEGRSMSFGAGVSIRVAGTNWKPMHHSAISVPYWQHAARAVRVEPVGTA